jgi:hypothetical protein
MNNCGFYRHSADKLFTRVSDHCIRASWNKPIHTWWDLSFAWRWIWRWLSSGMLHLDDGGSKLFWNVGQHVPDYTAQHPTRHLHHTPVEYTGVASEQKIHFLQDPPPPPSNKVSLFRKLSPRDAMALRPVCSPCTYPAVLHSGRHRHIAFRDSSDLVSCVHLPVRSNYLCFRVLPLFQLVPNINLPNKTNVNKVSNYHIEGTIPEGSINKMADLQETEFLRLFGSTKA